MGAVDFYLESCSKSGREPQKPCSGTLISGHHDRNPRYKRPDTLDESVPSIFSGGLYVHIGVYQAPYKHSRLLDAVTDNWYHFALNSRQRKILSVIFANPVSPAILWEDIEQLFAACGGILTKGRGSRVRVKLNGVLATFHRPHPERVTDKGAVKSVRTFLENAGVKP